MCITEKHYLELSSISIIKLQLKNILPRFSRLNQIKTFKRNQNLI